MNTCLSVTWALVFGFTSAHANYRARYRAKKLAQSSSIHFKIGSNKVAISDAFVDQCVKQFGYLNSYNDSFFNVQFLKQHAQVRQFLTNEYSATGDVPQYDCIKQGDLSIHVTYFNRTSPYVLFICGGFTNAREYMVPYVKLFPHYDLVFFDLPGHGIEKQQAHSHKGIMSDSLCGVNVEAITLGQAESRVIQSVVDYYQRKKYYTKKLAIARCYSVPFFALAALDWQKHHVTPLFDGMIIDSAFTSFSSFVPNFPRLFCSALHSPFLNHMSQTWLVKKCFSLVAGYFLPVAVDSCPSTASILNQLKAVDILFFHGSQDIAISLDDFESIWNGTEQVGSKAVIYTNNKHAMNHIKQKEVYASVCKTFIENSFESFGSLMLSHAQAQKKGA